MNKRKITSKHYRKLLNIILHKHRICTLYGYLVNGKYDYYKFCSRLYDIEKKKGLLR